MYEKNVASCDRPVPRQVRVGSASWFGVFVFDRHVWVQLEEEGQYVDCRGVVTGQGVHRFLNLPVVGGVVEVYDLRN